MSTVDAFIVQTTQVKCAIELVNATADDKFEAFAERILSQVHGKSGSSSFKAEELARLEKVFNVSDEKVQCMIYFVEFVYLQAAYCLFKAAQLQEDLLKLGVHDPKAAILANLWQREGKQLIEQIRTSKRVSPTRLERIKWRLNLNLASDVRSKLKAPNALFEFNLINDEPQTAKSNRDSFQIEFSKDQLYDFFNNLENIQKKIDELSS